MMQSFSVGRSLFASDVGHSTGLNIPVKLYFHPRERNRHVIDTHHTTNRKLKTIINTFSMLVMRHLFTLA
jgi:hypothetical protein